MEKIKGLSGLRGWSVLFVLLLHSHSPYFKGGFIGVEVFFVLSGFLITSILSYEWEKTGKISLKNFYVRRFLRLFPALFFLVIFYLIVTMCFSSQPLKHLTDAMVVLLYCSNWTRAFLIGTPDILGHTWSLSIEEQFYLIWPVLFIFIVNKIKSPHQFCWVLAIIPLILRLVFLTSSIAEGVVDKSIVFRIYNGFDTRFDSLLIGCGLAFCLKTLNGRPIFPRHRLRNFLECTVILFFIVFVFLGDGNGLYVLGPGFSLISVMALLLLALIIDGNTMILNRLTELSWMKYLGKISYGVYLWHYPIFRAFSALGCYWLTTLFWGGIIAIMIAHYSFFYLEKPVLKFKHRFYSYIPHSVN